MARWREGDLHRAGLRAPDLAAVSSGDPRLSATDVLGFTPLHVAAADGRLDLVEALLALDVDLDVPAIDGITPLGLAVRFGHVAVAAALIDAGSTVGAGPHPLPFLALLSGSLPTVELVAGLGPEVPEHDVAAWFGGVLEVLGYRVGRLAAGVERGSSGSEPDVWGVDRPMTVPAVLLEPIVRNGLVRANPRTGLVDATHVAVFYDQEFVVDATVVGGEAPTHLWIGLLTDAVHDVRRGVRGADDQVPQRRGHTATSLVQAYGHPEIAAALAEPTDTPPATDVTVFAGQLLAAVDELSPNRIERMIEADGGTDIRGDVGGAAYARAIELERWTTAGVLVRCGYRPPEPTAVDIAIMGCPTFPGDFPLAERTARIRHMDWSSPSSLAAVLALGPALTPTELATPLFRAARRREPGLIEVLIAAGADIEITAEAAAGVQDAGEEDDGIVDLLARLGTATPLIAAASTPSGGNVAALLAAGASVAAVDHRGRSALHHAVLSGTLEAVRTLLDAGADPNLPDADGMRPITGALDRSGWVLDTLVAGGATVDAADRQHCRSVGGHAWLDAHLAVAASTNRDGALAWFAAHDALPSGPTLLEAARDDVPRLVEVLLLAGVDPDTEDSTGSTALHHAARFGATRCIAALLAAGADVDRIDSERETPLLAVRDDPTGDATRALLAGGADVAAVDLAGRNALHLAARHGLPSGPDLLAAGADPELADRDGERPLDAALTYGHAELAGLLLERGVATARAGRSGRQVETIVDGCLLDRLLDGPGWPDVDVLHVLARHLPLPQFEELLGRVDDVEGADAAGERLLHSVAWADEGMQRVEGLVALGAGVDARTTDGRTPLMVAAAYGSTDTVAALLAAGADPGLRDQRGLDAAGHARAKLNWGNWDLLDHHIATTRCDDDTDKRGPRT